MYIHTSPNVSRTIYKSNLSKSCSNKTRRNHYNKIAIKSLKDIQKDLIISLSKNQNPENAFKISHFKSTAKNYNLYKENLEKNLSKYQMTCIEKKGSTAIQEENKKYICKKDENLIKKMHNLNKSVYFSTLCSRNEDCNLKIIVDQKNYGNPYQSLGVIKHNNHIYNSINKDFFYRQTCLFRNQIKYIQDNLHKIRSNVPSIHMNTNTNKNLFDIPTLDLNEEQDKKEINYYPLLTLSNGLKYFSYYKYPNKNFPECREQFSICIKDKNIFICGGLSVSSKELSIWSLDLEKMEWIKMKQKQITNNRFGHTGTLYNNKIYFYGGKVKTGNGSMSVGFEIFNLIDKNFSILDPIGEIPISRRGHIAQLIGNNIFYHGGITDDGEVLNDCFFLNLNSYKCFFCAVSDKFFSPKLYGHTSCLILPKEYNEKKLDIYFFPEVEITNTKIKEKGLYIFGGKSKEEGGFSNKLYILILGQKPLKWILPETKGKPPSARFFHSMNYFEKGNILIIHGGRNDMMSENSALNDTYAFDLETFEWINVELYSNLSKFKVLSRCGHQGAIYRNTLIILGGMNNSGYIGSALFIINLDLSYPVGGSVEDIMIKTLEQKKNEESKKKLNKIKTDLKTNNELGSVKSINLPMLK